MHVLTEFVKCSASYLAQGSSGCLSPLVGVYSNVSDMLNGKASICFSEGRVQG